MKANKSKVNKGEYRQFIKKSVEDGSFFKDSREWYLFSYVRPLCDRTWLFFTTIVSIIIFYSLIIVISNSLPIVDKVPVVVNAKDQGKYYPVISKLDSSGDLRTIEEIILKHFLIKYVQERESYDFTSMSAADLRAKTIVMKNNSTNEEYKRFLGFLDRSNPSSPINDSRNNLIRSVDINSFSFKRIKNKNFVSRAKNFVYEPLPVQADVGYELISIKNGKEESKKYVARIDFRFSNIDSNNLNKNLIFKVSNYKLFIDNT